MMDVVDAETRLENSALLKGIGNAVQTRRLQLNTTQDQLCKESGINKSVIVLLESGLLDVDIHTLYRIASALKCTVYYLLQIAESEHS
jgi:transcriptional regulator with XRE-family HTH domain